MAQQRTQEKYVEDALHEVSKPLARFKVSKIQWSVSPKASLYTEKLRWSFEKCDFIWYECCKLLNYVFQKISNCQ